LQLQAHRHQGIGAAQQQANDEDVHVSLDGPITVAR